MNPFIDLISNLIFLYNIILVAYIILSWLIAFNIVNKHQPFVLRLNYALTRMTEPVLRPIRKYLPDLGGIDISPIILFLLLHFLNNALYYYFYTY